MSSEAFFVASFALGILSAAVSLVARLAFACVLAAWAALLMGLAALPLVGEPGPAILFAVAWIITFLWLRGRDRDELDPMEKRWTFQATALGIVISFGLTPTFGGLVAFAAVVLWWNFCAVWQVVVRRV